jgi:hypothetical protein
MSSVTRVPQTRTMDYADLSADDGAAVRVAG